MDADEIILNMHELMEKSVAHTLHEFTTLHTGKASPAMVENVQVYVQSYGSTVSLREISAVTTPDARTIQIQPWDRNTLKDIEKAIQSANIGLNPSIQGNVLRVPVPELSGDRRKELVKVAHRMAEDGKIAIRHERHLAIEPLKKLQKDSKISEDDLKRLEKDIQKATDDHIEKIVQTLNAKETELLKVH
jgi:ribosome recycling factor